MAGQSRGNLGPENAGAYRFGSPTSPRGPLYRRGFGSIFGEWETTAEASRLHRTFPESLRFPAPQGKVRVVVEKRQGGDWREVWRVELDPADIFVDTAAPRRQQAMALERLGEPGDHLDLLLLGDGYTAEECRGEFERHARRLREALFAQHSTSGARTATLGICPPAEARALAAVDRRTLPSKWRHLDAFARSAPAHLRQPRPARAAAGGLRHAPSSSTRRPTRRRLFNLYATVGRKRLGD